MAEFYKEKMIPLLQNLVNRVETALEIPNITERTEQLLVTRNIAEAGFAALDMTVQDKIQTGMWLSTIGSLTAIWTGLIFSAPLAVPALGVLLIAGGTSIIISNSLDEGQIKTNKKSILTKIDSEISAILEDSLPEAIQSPLFRRKLEESFNPEAVAAKTNYQTLKNDVRKVPSPSAAP
ncbi:MAG: hypothetical protein Q8K65_08670 [Alphaproteobacteria bacterium]|nr:hypothetical protein [Alphaproteobacteria bacterium]